jgi:hypothetical protein
MTKKPTDQVAKSILELKKCLKWVKTDKKFAEERLETAKEEINFFNKKIIQIQAQIIDINNLSKN